MSVKFGRPVTDYQVGTLNNQRGPGPMNGLPEAQTRSLEN